MAEDPKTIFSRSMDELALKEEACQTVWKLAEAEDWDVDLDKGVIHFTGRNEVVVSAPLQIVGTFNTADDTWLWGWDHPSVDLNLAQTAKLCQDFGRQYHLPELTERKLQCTEDDAWRFTAVAVHLSKATSAYRAPFGPTLVFMTLGKMTMQKTR